MNEKILIIDDEEDILTLLLDTFESEDYQVLTAKNGQEGMDQFHSNHPDLVITDVKMPVKNGLEVLKEIKDSEPDVDVIILTGHSDEASAIDFLRNGAYDYLAKPLENIDVLLTAVSRALEKRKLELKNKQLVKKLADMAIRDPLTGLYNYRHMHTCLDEEIVRSKRYRNTFCTLMLDIDHFKAVNDTYGHPFGDHVLKKLSEIAIENVRSADRLYRCGGEEFFIILPETSSKKAFSVTQRLMEAIRSHTFECDGHQTKITVSMGGSFYPDQSKDKMELIKLADKALYRAKEMGRDRVVLPIDD